MAKVEIGLTSQDVFVANMSLKDFELLRENYMYTRMIPLTVDGPEWRRGKVLLNRDCIAYVLEVEK